MVTQNAFNPLHRLLPPAGPSAYEAANLVRQTGLLLGAEKVAQCFSQHLSMSLGESRGAQSPPTLHLPNEVHDILHPNVLYDIEWAHGLPDPRQECVIEGQILSRDKGALGQELLDSLQASRIQLSRGKLSSWRWAFSEALSQPHGQAQAGRSASRTGLFALHHQPSAR